ncbi:hypothetical protein [Phyllobacterium sp. SB3]|uniref:hypothetical protein n=1 Tax=Phyllobacterium sp. SB3 TaxID=3156073 RepID=UPI0032AEF6ED
MKFASLAMLSMSLLLAGCASPQTTVLKPYTLSNGAVYQDVISVATNGKGTAPTITHLKTFDIGKKGDAKLVAQAASSERSMTQTVSEAAVTGLARSLPISIAVRNQRNASSPQVNVSNTNSANSQGSTNNNSANNEGNTNNSSANNDGITNTNVQNPIPITVSPLEP